VTPNVGVAERLDGFAEGNAKRFPALAMMMCT